MYITYILYFCIEAEEIKYNEEKRANSIYIIITEISFHF